MPKISAIFMCRNWKKNAPRRDTCTLSSTNALSRTAEKPSEKIGESFAALQNNQSTALLLWVLCFVSEPGQVGSQGGIRHKESIDAVQKTITARARRSSCRKFRRFYVKKLEEERPQERHLHPLLYERSLSHCRGTFRKSWRELRCPAK